MAPVDLLVTLVLLAVGMLQSAVQEQAACTHGMQFTLVMHVPMRMQFTLVMHVNMPL